MTSLRTILKTYGLVGAALIILTASAVADWRVFTKNGGHEGVPKIVEEEAARAAGVAREWILASSPTYLFDGSALSEGTVTASQDGRAHRISFSFESSHGGYGDRAGLVTTEAVTPHTTVIDVKNGTVIQAITDERYNELTGAIAE